MRAQSLKYHRGTAFYKSLMEIGKKVTYTEWWPFVFPTSQKMVEILSSRIRPNRNKETWAIANEIDARGFQLFQRKQCGVGDSPKENTHK